MTSELNLLRIFILVIGMSLVTYIPRALPMLFLKEFRLNPSVENFLKLIPYAALGALIFPEILFSTNHMASSVTGGILAAVVAYFKGNLLIAVVAGIFGTVLYQWLFL